jgi:CRISPR type III-B/RAMP module-associated protein Cmr5
MRTLAQIRAANAWHRKGSIEEKHRLPGFPSMIRTDGLLAALAFAVEKDLKTNAPKHKGEFSIASAIVEHLACDGVGKITKAQNADALVAELAAAPDAALLRRATAEALAYLNYLKRFVA